MVDYTVKWEIKVEANSFRDAALKARKIQRDPNTQAAHYTVIDATDVTVPCSMEVDTSIWVHTLDDGGHTDEILAYKNLLSKVQEVLHNLMEDVPDKLNKLKLSGSGVVDDHTTAMAHGKNYACANKVVEALLMAMIIDNKPPRDLNTKQYEKEVINYFTLL